MNKLVNGLVATLSSAAKGKKNNRRGPQRRRQGGRRGLRPNRDVGAWSRALPAAYSSHVKASFRVINRNQNSMTVGGCDLVTPISRQVVSAAGDTLTVFSCITCNPAYWTGTRIAGIAPLYQDYRPIRMIFRYIPQVAVTQPGTVVMGTLWKGASPSTDFQQTLVTSNGGNMINCYIPANSAIELGSNLDRNLYGVSGELSPETNPFLFLATTRGCLDTEGRQVVPGYFYVEYVFRFKNPIGEAWKFSRSEVTTTPYNDWQYPNRSLVLLEQNGNYGPGTVLDVEVTSSGDTQYNYRGSAVTLAAGTAVQAFENGQLGTTSNTVSLYTNDLSQINEDIGWRRIPWVYSGTVTSSSAQPVLACRYFATSTQELGSKNYTYVIYRNSATTVTVGTDAVIAYALIGHDDDSADGNCWVKIGDSFFRLPYSGGTLYTTTPPPAVPNFTTQELVNQINELKNRLAVVEDDQVALVPLATARK